MLDTEPLYKVAWQRAASELGYELDDVSYAKLLGRSTKDCEQALVVKFGSEFPLARFGSRWPELWRTEAECGIRQKPGLLDFLAFVTERGVPVAVATSSDAHDAHFSLLHAGLDGRFGTVVTVDQVARGKPAPDIYLEAARRLQVAPAHCVALEDSEPGVLSAVSAGMIALLIPDSTPPSDAAVRSAFRVLRSLNEALSVIEILEGGSVQGSTAQNRA